MSTPTARTRPPVFVFGSNLAGRHGKGAALHARQHYGAEYGVNVRPTGGAYAIPTKGWDLRPLPLDSIAQYVALFIQHARRHPDTTFFVTAIGTGLAGYYHDDIAPMFAGAPPNCQLPGRWAGIIAKAEAVS
jgi:hypothetical protein